MNRYILTIMYGLVFLLPAVSIEIVDIRGLDHPEVPQEYTMTSDPAMSLGLPELSWIGNDTLLYKQSPLYLSGYTVSGSFSRILEIEKYIVGKYDHLNSVTQADAVAIAYGKSMGYEYLYGFYSTENGWIDIDRSTYDRLIMLPEDEEFNRRIINSPDRELINFWEHRLLGGYAIVPSPVYDVDNYGLSIHYSETMDWQIISPYFIELRSAGSPAFVAVSFDRFRLALTASYIRLAEPVDTDEPQPFIFVMRVVYDGELRESEDIRSEPSWDSPITGRLNAGTEVKVQDADRYTVTDSGEEDFWYRVESGIHSGWVFGGSLIIEDEDWQGRLEDRGRPLDLSPLTAGAAGG